MVEVRIEYITCVVSDMYRIYVHNVQNVHYVLKYNYMFRRLTMAIFRLYMKC